MALSRIATVLGGLLLSQGGRRLAGRHAGKLALATLAYQLWSNHRARNAPVQPGGRSQTQGMGKQGTGKTAGKPHRRQRWSGRTG